MLKYLIIASMFFCTGFSFAQSTVKEGTISSNRNNKPSFETWCLTNAVSLISNQGGKTLSEGVKKVAKPNVVNPTFKDYGFELLEDKAQYFTIEGSNELYKVESLFRLRLMYNAVK